MNLYSLKSPIILLVFSLTLAGCQEEVAAPEVDSETVATPTTQSAHGPAQQATLSQQLAEVRRATAPYQDLKKARADGYTQFSIHVPNMGYHYLHESAISENKTSALDEELDRTEPEVLVYVDDAPQSDQRRLVAAEYAVPKTSEDPPEEAATLFSGADAHDWHVHPSVHELPLSDSWTIHGECHYEGGLGVFLAEKPGGDSVFWTPPTGAFGSWSGTVGPDQCPSSLGGNPLPPLLIAHGKWWTLHAWVWFDNPEGVFHPTNPRVQP